VKDFLFTDLISFVGEAPKKFDGYKKYVSTGAVNGNIIESDDIELVDYSSRPSRANLVACSGDILFAKMAETEKTLLLDDETEKNIYSTGFCAIRAKDNIIEPKALYYLLGSSLFLNQKNTNSSGATQRAITNTGLSKIRIKLPTMEKQREFCGIMDKVVDSIELRKKQLGYFDKFTKSLFIEMFGDIINTSKYPTVNLGSLGEMLSGGTPSSEHSEYFGGNIPFISTPCLGENYISYKNAQNFLTDEGVKNSTTNLIPAYSLMIGSRVGVGKCSINMCEMCTNQDILSFINIDKTKYDLLFIKNVIEQHFDFYESQKRGATIKGISSKIVKETKVPKAPLLLQKKFANFVIGTDKSKLAVKKSLEELEILKKSLMQKYFA
jgi:hypothetical protein